MITKRSRPLASVGALVVRCRLAINQSLHIADGCQDRRLSGGFRRAWPPAIASQCRVDKGRVRLSRTGRASSVSFHEIAD